MEIRKPEAEPITLKGGVSHPWLLLLAIVAVVGHARLLWTAQGLWFVAYLLVVPIWAVLYFTWYDRLGRRLSQDWDPALPRASDVGLVNGACLIFAVVIVQALIWGSRGSPVTTEGAIREKYVQMVRPGRQPQFWRVVTEDGSWFYVPYGSGAPLKKGDVVRLTHRDAWLGVRFVESYQLPGRPVTPYDQMRVPRSY